MAVGVLLVGCGHASAPMPPAAATAATSTAPAVAPVRVLMITATAAFRHDSIPAARTAVAALASRTGAFTVAATEDLREVTAGRLASTDVLMFALTTGELAFD